MLGPPGAHFQSSFSRVSACINNQRKEATWADLRAQSSCILTECRRVGALQKSSTCSVCKAHVRGRGADGRGVHGKGFGGSQGLLKLPQKQGGSCLAPGCRPCQRHVQALEALQEGALSLRAALGQVSTWPGMDVEDQSQGFEYCKIDSRCASALTCR